MWRSDAPSIPLCGADDGMKAFVGMLMHLSLTACALILTPQTTGVPLLAYGLVFAAAVWVVIAATVIGAPHNLHSHGGYST